MPRPCQAEAIVFETPTSHLNRHAPRSPISQSVSQSVSQKQDTRHTPLQSAAAAAANHKAQKMGSMGMAWHGIKMLSIAARQTTQPTAQARATSSLPLPAPSPHPLTLLLRSIFRKCWRCGKETRRREKKDQTAKPPILTTFPSPPFPHFLHAKLKSDQDQARPKNQATPPTPATPRNHPSVRTPG